MNGLGITALIAVSWLMGPSSAALVLPQSNVTLYSVNKHSGERLIFCLSFLTGPTGTKPCDLRYGSLYVGEDLDWFESSGSEGNRSVIKDLGLKRWDDAISIPVVEPLPKLKPGEQRIITIDSSGADGADGAPGAPGRPGADADGVIRPRPAPETPRSAVAPVPSRPRHDGKPRVDPMYVKAIVGHLYVIHVVDDTRDFYALFRVEAIDRGSNCTISWRLVDAPQSSARNQQK